MGTCHGSPLDSGGVCSPMGPDVVYGKYIRIPDQGYALRADGMDWTCLKMKVVTTSDAFPPPPGRPSPAKTL